MTAWPVNDTTAEGPVGESREEGDPTIGRREAAVGRSQQEVEQRMGHDPTVPTAG